MSSFASEPDRMAPSSHVYDPDMASEFGQSGQVPWPSRFGEVRLAFASLNCL